MIKLKGIILAGGTGSRLYPLTKVTNKHLLPVGKKPMIYYGIEKLVQAGITDIMIISGTEHLGDLVSLLGSGRAFQCQLTYRVQDEAGGIAQALSLAEAFIGTDRMIVLLGDNIFESPLRPIIEAYQRQASGAHLVLSYHEAPHRFGVATLAADSIIKITEKPEIPESNYIVTGIYGYDATVFDYIHQCRPSQRQELEITDVNNAYIQANQCGYTLLPGWWSDAGTFDSLYSVTEHMRARPIQ